MGQSYSTSTFSGTGSSCTFAGSAIAQGPNVGRIDRWSEWDPTTAEPLWLLLSGASDPPSGINITDRRTRDVAGVRSGSFLSGVTHDLANVEDAVGTKLFNTVKDLYLTKSAAFEKVRKLFDTCNRREVKPMLYYTGHGEVGTGNWCLADGTISIQEIVDLLPEGTYYPMIFSDACYSGHWANFCCEKNIAGFHCLAACPEHSTALDTRGEGGDLTLFMTGKKQRPSTEPVYSGGNRNVFPITSGYNEVEYTDFISSHLFNSENILVTQSMCNGTFSGCFAPSRRYNPRPALTWAIRYDYDSFLELVEEKWEWINGKSYSIYSLACDEDLGFGVVFMRNYGTAQTIIMTGNTSIQKKYDEGFVITACAARGSTFYVIMTKDTEEYKDKTQKWITRNTWTEANNEIQKEYKEGKAITGICYSTGLKQYGVVMTESSEGQTYKWFDDGPDTNNWMDEKRQQGYHPTIIFKDPTDNKILVVMTADQNRSDYIYRINYKLKKA